MNNAFSRTAISAVVLVLAISPASASSPGMEGKKPLPIHHGGRVVVGESNGMPTYTYSWPGVYFEAAFAGTEVDVRLDDGNNILNVIIDGQAHAVLSRPGKKTYSINNLAEGEHRIRLEKRTETQYDTGTFEGFFIPDHDREITLEKPKRSMEFIGDSAVIGYGIRSPKRECSDEEIFSFTDTQLTYAALAAKALGADYQINALSGLGVVRNYNGAMPGQTFPSLYPYALNDKGVLYQGDWSPDIIVIGLGGNDFATPLNPGERWETRAALQDDFVESHEKFILGLREKRPEAHFVLLSYDPINKELESQVARVVEKLKTGGEDRIDLVGIRPATLSACQWHPSEADHKDSADILINHIEANPALWN